MSPIHAVICGISIAAATLTACTVIRCENERLTRHPEDLTEEEVTGADIAIAAGIAGIATYAIGRVFMAITE
jgi:hypothetical protein